MSVTYRWIHRVWYEDARSGWLLRPLSGVYWLILRLRSMLYRRGILKTYNATVPVIVVGNITAGGSGKTPTVLWLVYELRARGFSPGIVSRGYGGSKSGSSMRVDASSDAAVVGDEPVLLAKRGQCPVAVDADRVSAAAMLVDDGVDVIISDDGLQHLRLNRDYEICVIDGQRGLGNQRLLPAGPMRESAERLARVDLVLANGSSPSHTTVSFELEAGDAVRVNGSLARPLGGFRDTTVHAVAGIGNPGRFFDMLREFGIQVIEHGFPDHAALSPSDLKFGDEFPVFMTEKDAVKLKRNQADKIWYVPVDLKMTDGMSDSIIDTIEQRLREHGEHS